MFYDKTSKCVQFVRCELDSATEYRRQGAFFSSLLCGSTHEVTDGDVQRMCVRTDDVMKLRRHVGRMCDRQVDTIDCCL